MRKPNRLVTLLYGLIGKAWAYESADDVREVIADNCFNTLAQRSRTHTKNAAGLADSFAFQPGLIDLHDELHDTWHYLTALKARARELGCATLADSLGAATDATSDTLERIATAAEATIPAPEVPASK